MKEFNITGPGWVEVTEFHVIDSKNGDIIGKYKTRKRASQKVDRMDIEYGAYRYYVKPVEIK